MRSRGATQQIGDLRIARARVPKNEDAPVAAVAAWRLDPDRVPFSMCDGVVGHRRGRPNVGPGCDASPSPRHERYSFVIIRRR